MLQAFGGCCCVCGYSRSPRAMDFHHLDGADKAFSLGSVRASPKAWTLLAAELRKCVLVCNRCHQEVHDGLSEIPADAPRFDETYAVPVARKAPGTPCEVCGTSKSARNLACSPACSAVRRSRLQCGTAELQELAQSMSAEAIGRRFGVTGAAVRKRLKKAAGALAAQDRGSAGVCPSGRRGAADNRA